MTHRTNVSDCMGSYFGMPDAPCRSVVPLLSAPFTMSRLERSLIANERPIIRLPVTEAYFLMLYFESATHCDIMPDETLSSPRRYERHTVCLVDLASGPAIELQSRLDALAFVIPKELLREISENPADAAPRLRCRRGEADPIIASLAQAMLPMFADRYGDSRAVFQHLAIAICAHLLHGFAQKPLHIAQDWLQTVQRLMHDRMGEPFQMAEIASAVGMTGATFDATFRARAGISPETWLTHARIRRAMTRLRRSLLPIEEIARSAGFRDLTRFEEEFHNETGMTPDAWRKFTLH
ncbi:AraC family transcriptional regulator [Paracoccus aestuariivivens]|uniref:Helix-turn-helix domain-containing protein n=1 Tax=Paracoccus aestuariivivens TaxID=1820333 RepID=A0A6L6JEY2_9RHOB|nr:AraC family transcriptional regulator [Paracoccus aestuariivivens]MTH79147.1 helix-turn-helix domain-containing protein [Paracoccus aestuariivivens]